MALKHLTRPGAGWESRSSPRTGRISANRLTTSRNFSIRHGVTESGRQLRQVTLSAPARGSDAGQTIGLFNIYLGDRPSWWNQQHDRSHNLIRATTVAGQHKLIEQLWP